MKKKIVSMLVGLGVAFTVMFGSMTASVATAEPAEAASYSNCYALYENKSSRSALWGYEKWCYVDYNWWESRWWTNNRDGWKYMGQVGYYTVFSHYAGRH